MLSLWRKINVFLNKYFQNNYKKQLTTNLNKWVVDEKVIYEKKKTINLKTKSQNQNTKVVKKQLQDVIKKVEKKVLEKVVEVRKEKKPEEVKIAK